MRIAKGCGYASGSNAGSGSGAAPENQLPGCGGSSASGAKDADSCSGAIGSPSGSVANQPFAGGGGNCAGKVSSASGATERTVGSFSDQAGRVSSIWVSACVGLPGVGAGPARGMWEGQVALVRPWAAFGRPRGLERGHSGGSMYKVGFGRGRLLPTSVVLIDLY